MNRLLKMGIGILATVMIQLTMAIGVCGQRSTHTKKSPNASVDLYFWEYLPAGYSASTPGGYPLIVFLHGRGDRANPAKPPMKELDNVLRHGPPKEIDEGKEMCFRVNGIERCFIVLSPQLVEPNTYWNQHPSDLIEYALDELNVDPNRIYVTGLSMGGIGTLRLAQSDPEWAHASGIAAVSVAPGGSASVADAKLFAQRDIALWAVHSVDDYAPGTEWPKTNSLVNAINAWTTPVPTPLAHLTTLSGSAHDVWSDFYKTDHSSYFPNVYEWFLLNPKGASNTHPLVPGVYAGNNQNITANTVTLMGTAGDNANGKITSYQWTKHSGPSSYDIANENSLQTQVSNLVTGTYVFRLTVEDNDDNTQYDQVTITVSLTNIPPVANAGTDKNITLPTNSVDLTGLGTDSDGSINRYQWSKISGPSSFTIAAPNSANTSVTDLVQGNYVFQLKVTDDDNATDKDSVAVAVGSGEVTWQNPDVTEVNWMVTLSGEEAPGERMASANNNWLQGKNNSEANEPIEISEIESKELSFGLYPNPVENNLHLEGVGKEADLKIYDVQRNLSFDTKITSNNGTYDLGTETLKPGIYYLILQSNQQRYQRKFIKE